MKLHVDQVSKKYRGKVWALQNFELEITPGIVGLLGPNGAGKSTLLKILATITKPTLGRVVWDGVDVQEYPNKIRSVLGYLPQDFGIYDNLNAIEFLKYIALLKGLNHSASKKVIHHLLEVVHLADVATRKLGTYSGGMKQRIGIAQALLNNPQILIVDEPTVGLDPQERINFRNMLSDLAGEKIIILSTHIVADIETLAGKIAIMNHGKLITYSEPEELLAAVDGQVWETMISSSELEKFRKKYIINSVGHGKSGTMVRFKYL
ncbi:MAG: ABC transporter ATP-binding protein [Halanaerobiales bacterium]|nr:ABC transporter ATP-binding protein [Halanaerobiales bacterium]